MGELSEGPRYGLNEPAHDSDEGVRDLEEAERATPTIWHPLLHSEGHPAPAQPTISPL